MKASRGVSPQEGSPKTRMPPWVPVLSSFGWPGAPKAVLPRTVKYIGMFAGASVGPHVSQPKCRLHCVESSTSPALVCRSWSHLQNAAGCVPAPIVLFCPGLGAVVDRSQVLQVLAVTVRLVVSFERCQCAPPKLVSLGWLTVV